MGGFYTNVFSRGERMFVRGYDHNGNRFKRVFGYKPYLFIASPKGLYRTIDGRPADKVEFESMGEARDFIRRYEGVSGFDVYGMNNYQYVYIHDEYPGEIHYIPNKISIVTIDIECAADEGFPDTRIADKPITAITLRKNGMSVVFGCGEFVTTDTTVTYYRCTDEIALLKCFLEIWQSESFSPDIVTGWNIEFFDIPYIVNRISRLLGNEYVKKLSPFGFVDERNVEFMMSSKQTFNIQGISVLDYYQIYKKFSFGNQESYKLDYIAQVELGERKIDYSEYGSLLMLYKNNFQKFIEYNIYDCVLVDRLEEKLKFLEQIMALAYDAKVNYNDTTTTVRPWDVIIHNYLLDRGIVIPQMKRNDDNFKVPGGYVKDPNPGWFQWVVSFDLNSLYPHLIMQYNISPETFVKRIHLPDVSVLAMGDTDIPDESLSVAANGCCYRKDNQGFLPALMEKMYNDRVEYKQKMIEAKKSFEKTKSKEDEMLVARYHNMQMAKKIQLNSAYGALANIYFRWFDPRHAEAITTSGQLSIRWIERRMNTFMNSLIKTSGIDYVIACDTDSMYINMDAVVRKLIKSQDKDHVITSLDRMCEEMVQPFLDRCYGKLAEYMHAYQQKMKMKRETIADKGIWTGKKHYILNAWNIEGVQYSEPKLKIQGIEAVRSSTPGVCRENIKKAIKVIMNEDEKALQKLIREFKAEFAKLPFEDVAFPRSVSDINKYRDARSIYTSGTPIHVKGSLLFNDLLKKHNLTNIQPIQNGDKIRFAYLKKPNPVYDTVIATPDTLPEEFKLDKYIDRDLQFEKSFIDPIRTIANVIGWEVEERATLDSFFG